MLGWSIRLFRVLGVMLEVHVTFLLLLGYVAWEGWRAMPEAHFQGVAWTLAYVLLLFTCVVLHEFGHALTAQRYGVGVPRILLLPIGGMAEFDSIPRNPQEEITIALAGPAVNFLIVSVLLVFVPFPREIELGVIEFSAAAFGQHLIVMNLAMGCFNLVPAFPMDGGRVLRALLARRLPYVRATFLAATVAKVLALTGIVFALFHPEYRMLAVLFAFIFWAGEIEYRGVKRQEIAAAHERRFYARLAAERAARGE